MGKIRVVFMGTPSYATEILKALLKEENFEICALFTQSDKPANRGKLLTPPHIKSFVLENYPDIPIYQPTSIRDEETKNILKSYNPDFIVVAAYGKILPLDILNIAPCINLHASLLPKYRGASPIQYTILNDDSFGGVTAMKMEQGLDSGEMLGYTYVNAKGVDVNTLFDELSKKASKLTIKILNNYNKILHVKQNDAQVSFARKIVKEDGLCDFTFTCKELTQKFLAYNPWPGLYLQNGIKLKAFTCKQQKHNFKIGEIVSINDTSIEVACYDGFVNITRLNPPSKQEMNAADFIRGKRIEVGNTLN
ncbi:MAG: methionyl-tRNA formyltransferase, partial [Campylobacteraceae bacterium]